MKGDRNAKRNARSQDVRGAEGQGLQQGQVGADSAVANGASAGNGQAAQVPAPKSAGETFAESAYLTLTEERAHEVLVKARGDIFITAQLLKISVIQLRHFIKGSTTLQKAVQATQEKAVEGDVTALSDQQYADAIADRERLYRIVALDAIHDLAVMPISDKSSQNSVKLAAASRLAGPTAQESASTEIAETLRQLNDAYQSQAPRIKLVRETVTIERPSADAKDVTPQAPSD